MPRYRSFFIAGMLVVLMPPVGLLCLYILFRDWRAARRSHGEVPRSASARVEAMLVAQYGPGVRRTRPRSEERWTRVEDYVG